MTLVKAGRPNTTVECTRARGKANQKTDSVKGFTTFSVRFGQFQGREEKVATTSGAVWEGRQPWSSFRLLGNERRAGSA